MYAARLGYAAKGVVYSMVGVLALKAALGMHGGRLTGSKGAVNTLASQPFATALLVATAIGLLGYAIWNAVRAIKDPEHKGSDGQGLAKRAVYAVTSLSHLALAFYAVQLVRGASRSSDNTRQMVGEALSLPFGRVLVAALGLILVGFGFHQLKRAIQNRLDMHLSVSEMTPNQQRFAQKMARFGTSARGLVFGIIGVSLCLAALHHDASEAQGLGEALREVLSQPFGEVLLAVVAAGLLSYGVYQLFAARFATIPEST